MFSGADRDALHTIEVVTKSARDESTHIWSGNSDGTYDILVAEKSTIGTNIKLTLRGGMYDWYEAEEISEGFEKYGNGSA